MWGVGSGRSQEWTRPVPSGQRGNQMVMMMQLRTVPSSNMVVCMTWAVAKRRAFPATMVRTYCCYFVNIFSSMFTICTCKIIKLSQLWLLVWGETKYFYWLTSSQSFSPASTDTDKKVKFMSDQKTWMEALQYCRTHHTDLASGDDQLEMISDKTESWTGYFRDHWRWSDGSDSSFRNWETHFDGKGKCALSLESGMWKPQNCDDKKPFICYKGWCHHPWVFFFFFFKPSLL